MTLFRLISRNRIPFSVFAAVIAGVYEWALNRMPFGEYKNVTTYIVSSPRDTYFNQNREGIFSFLGVSISEMYSDERISVDIFGRC